MKRVLVPVLVVAVLAVGLVFSPSVLEQVAVVVPGLGASKVAEGQTQVCVWYTEAPHKELARRNRTGKTCPSPPVVPHATSTTKCAHGGRFRYTGNDGVGWWYVSVCNPIAPTGLTCKATTTTIELSWTAGGSPSRFQVSKDGGVSWQAPSPVTSTSHTFSGLAADTSYPLRVQAGNTSGTTTAWSLSAGKSCDTDALPRTAAAPTGLECAATPFSIEMSWTAADDADRYQVSKDGGETWVEPSPATSTSYTFTELSAVTLYALSVQAGVDDGAATTWGTVSTEPATLRS